MQHDLRLLSQRIARLWKLIADETGAEELYFRHFAGQVETRLLHRHSVKFGHAAKTDFAHGLRDMSSSFFFTAELFVSTSSGAGISSVGAIPRFTVTAFAMSLNSGAATDAA